MTKLYLIRFPKNTASLSPKIIIIIVTSDYNQENGRG